MATQNKVEINVTADTAKAVAAVSDLKGDFVELGAKGASSAKQLEGAWSTVGAKSFSDTRNEINKVNIALEATKATSKNPLEIKLATQAAQQRIEALEGNLKGLKVSTTGIGGALAGIAPGFAAAFTGAELVRTITQADSLKRGLEAITGSTQGAQAELAFIKRTAGDLGLELNSAGQAYLSLSAATKGTNLEGEKTKEIFTSVSRAMSALGKSSAETDLALRAVSQIASKGTVSMEELRGQLGEALPGALKAAADGMGVTTQELIKMVESGGVLAGDLLPKLAASLDKIYAGKPVTSLTAEFNRFKNEITEVGTQLGEAGLTKALGDAAVVGAKAVGFLGTSFVGLGQGIGNVAGAVATLNFKPLADDLQRVAEKAGLVTPAIAGVQGALDAQKKSADEAGEASKTAFRKLEIAALNAGPELTKTATNAVAAFDKLRTSGDTAAEAVAKIGKDFDLGNSAGIRDASLALNKLAADGKISASELQAAWANLLKGIDLQKFEADAKKAFSGANQDAKLLEQTLDAGLRQAITRTGLDFDVIKGGMGKAAASAVNDTEVMIAGLDRLKKQGVDTGQVLVASIGKGIATADSQKAIEAVRGQIESLRKTLGDKVADGLLDQAAQKARALSDQADKAKPGINSLREAMLELGLKSREDLASTAQRAKAAYDEIIKAGQQEGESYIAWQKRKADAFDAMQAKAVGGAKDIANAFKDLGIQTQQELDATAARMRQSFDLAESSGKASAASLASAFKKVLEAQIAASGGFVSEMDKAKAAALGLEVAVDKSGKTIVRAFGESEKAVDKYKKSLDDAKLSTEQLAEAERKRLNVDKDGFTLDKNGSRLNAGGDLTTLTGIKNFLKQAGLNDDQAQKTALEFSDGRGNIPYLDNPGQKQYGGFGDTISAALLKAAEKITFGGSRTQGAQQGAQQGGNQGLVRTTQLDARVKALGLEPKPNKSQAEYQREFQADFDRAVRELTARGLDRGLANEGANLLTTSTDGTLGPLDYLNDRLHGLGLLDGKVESENDAFNVLAQYLGGRNPKKSTASSERTPSNTTATTMTVVKIDLGDGRTKDVTVAAKKDADALIEALRAARMMA